MKDKIHVGIIGFGTVGTGTAKILIENRELIKKRTGIDFILKRIADLDIKRDRGIKVPEGVLTTDAGAVINDPDIDVVVELMGGIHPAKDFMLNAVKNKKHVVTANKALIATEGNEIFAEAEKNGVEVGFEASVAGGIPIIKVLREGLVANNIVAVYGIINGTSNYILTKMTDEKVEFSDALKEAQRLGYAEADPTFDIEGIDTAHKLTILSSLSYGIPLSYNEVYKEGITKITAQDIEFASELGYKIKLLAITKLSNGEIEMRVHPTMIPNEYLISKVDGVFNAVYVEGDAVGSTLYYGRGAGDMPTGSAVVADIVDIARCDNGQKAKGIGYVSADYKIRKMEDIESMYYFRFSAMDQPGVLSKISGILGNYNISIASVIQKGRRLGGSVPLVVLAHTAKERDVLSAVKEIDNLPVVSDKTLFIRVEGKEE
ncbi:MAG TPA: homoserine dehydrogenase [Nitrospiraceae bacterium]|nr:MAG: homoserine dehydrogenase [Nitrospirae bacterium GWA2_46_11]OGW24883.1 MAG: homoserine dehydrogenase [Nitrospirae bacterium GWB2_47_37]HAK88326.1 homoserine dehydrogenase [Nitrospiraceae bacterium]HCZ11334.1 homoserine dehydrogenase [Nitrospiraceae bacterium]